MEWKWGGESGRRYLPKAVPGKAVKAVFSLEGEKTEGNRPGERTADREPEEGLWLEFLDANGHKVDELLVEERAVHQGMEAGSLEKTVMKTGCQPWLSQRKSRR